MRSLDILKSIITGRSHKGVDGHTSKLRWALSVSSKHKANVSNAIIELLDPVEHLEYFITYDYDKEFAGHEQVNKTLNCMSYFVKLYHSWAHGKNEDTNGHLR